MSRSWGCLERSGDRNVLVDTTVNYYRAVNVLPLLCAFDYVMPFINIIINILYNYHG